MKSNPIGWFEIPVTDMDRAIKFYEAVFGYSITRAQMGPLDMGWFPWSEELKGCSGSLVKHEEMYKPSDSKGCLIYFSSEDVNNELGKIEAAGGKVLVPKTQISEEIGFMAIFLDTEGNRVAVHSRN